MIMTISKLVIDIKIRKKIDKHTSMKYAINMNEIAIEFIETRLFSKQRDEILTDDEYRQFQNELIKNPEKGKVIPHTESLRKIRWQAKGHGKRGGMRAIYYYKSKNGRIYLMFAYTKNKQTDLTPEQAKILNEVARGFENEQ